MRVSPTIAVRAIAAPEIEDFLRVLCAAFRLSDDAARPLFHADPFFDLSHKRALWRNGELISCLTVVPVTLRLGGRWASLGGIAGVATRPDCQGQGYASALLKATAQDIPGELGYALSGLLTDAPALYARLGWQTVPARPRRRVAPARLPVTETSLSVRELALTDTAAWNAVSRLHAQTQPNEGACRRDPRRWQVIRAMTPGRRAFLCDSGYLIADPAPKALRVQEMVALAPAARAALFACLAAQPVRELDFSAVAAVHLDGFGDPAASDPDFMLRPPQRAPAEFRFSPLDQF